MVISAILLAFHLKVSSVSNIFSGDTLGTLLFDAAGILATDGMFPPRD
jgi:hypothetical protein